MTQEAGNKNQQNQPNNYGNRADGTTKGSGYFGELKIPGTDGVATEYSIGVNIDGKDVEIPTLVPGMTRSEINAVLQAAKEDKDVPESIVSKAVDHAKKRIKKGMSPFASDKDRTALPEFTKDDLKPEVLENLSFDDLVLLRGKLEGKPEDETVAPYEHKAFVKQYLGDANAAEFSPRVLGLLAAIPGYQLKKLVSRKEGETPPSMEQMVKSLEGVNEAINERIVEPWKRKWNSLVEESPAEAPKTASKPWERQWASPTPSRGKKDSRDYSALSLAKRSAKQQATVDEIMDLGNYSKEDNRKFNDENRKLIERELQNPNLPEATRKQYMSALGK